MFAIAGGGFSHRGMIMAGWREVLRRLYHDWVTRRARVRVVPAQEATELTVPPVFIIGPYRSGTTLVRYVLDSHSRIAVPPESNFLCHLQPLVDDEHVGRGFSPMGFDRDHVASKLRDFALYFFANYAASKSKPRWGDKTPDYVDHLPFLRELFPEAQFIMLYRHGLDQAHSYTRGGALPRAPIEPFHEVGEDLRLPATRYWRAQTEKMLDFEQAHPHRCIRLFYETLCAAPEQTLKPMFAFLEEQWEPDVLEFYRFDHEQGNEDGRAAATRGFAVSQGHCESWDRDLYDRCLSIAAPTLQSLGYAT